MRLSELIHGLSVVVEPAEDPEVLGIAHDSRRVEPGDLFVALAGQIQDGRTFVEEAEARGAAAVLGSGSRPERLEGPWAGLAGDPRPHLCELASRLYAHPDRDLLTVGVTGTNGKSTVVELIASILETAGRPAARFGTLGYRFRERRWDGERTTPEATDLVRVLRSVRDLGAAATVMEVSSHALAMSRVAALRYDLALFTNLSRDHLDFHGSLEEYYRAKRTLFDQLAPGGRAVVSLEDPWGRRLAGEIEAPMTYGLGGDVRVSREVLDTDGIRVTVETPRGALEVRSALLGAFNLQNLLAAVAAAEALELDREAIVRGIAAVRPLPGRMEPVECGQPFPVYIDFAHTEAALEAALRSVRGFSGERRILVVFGCGGDRDTGKRRPMGRVAGELADIPIITSDNPRSEDPLAIIAEVESGVLDTGNDSYRVIPDRREAIRGAVRRAAAGWVLVVAGKGHETVQIVGGQRLPFSDRAEVAAALEERFGTAKSS